MPFSATRDLWLVLKARDEGSRAMRSFSRDIRQVGDTVRMANLQASRSALINQMATQRLSGASQADMLVTQRRIAGIDDEIGHMKLARAEMEENRVSAQRMGAALGGAAGMITTAGTAMVALGAFGIMGLKDLVSSAVEYEKQSALTVTQVDKFGASLKDIEDIGLRVARTIGVPFQEIQPALFDIFSSMEVSIADAETLLETFSKAAVAGQTDIQSASRATIGILNAFHLPVTDLNHLMDVQFQLVKEGVGTYDEWSQRIGLVTPSAARAGQSVEMMAAALAVSTRMGISAARSGTAVARAMDAMSNPVAVENLKELGVNATDAEGNFRPMIDVLKEFRAKIADLPEEDKVAKILEVFKGAGGTIEARRFLQNMLVTPGNLELFQQIFETMSTETGSFEQAYSVMANTTATKTELMKNQWESLKVTMGQFLQPSFDKIIGFFSRLFEWYNNLDPEHQKLIARLTALGIAASIVGGILLLLVGAVVGFVAVAAMAGSALWIVLAVLGLVAAGFAGLAASIYLAWQKSTDFRTLVRFVGQELQDFYQNYLLPTAKEIQTAWNEKVLPPLERLWRIIDARVLPILRHLMQYITTEGLDSLRQLGNVIKEVLIWSFDKLGKIIDQWVIPAIAWLTKYYHEHEETIQMIISALIWLGKWLLIIIAIILGVVIVVFIGPLVAAFLAAAFAIGMMINFVIQLIEWFQHMVTVVEVTIAVIRARFLELVAAVGNLGAMLVDGFNNGIRSRFEAVKQTIMGLGGMAVDWLKRALGIASPSKEFMKLGVSSMDGYIMGIKRTMPAIEAQTVATAAGLTGAVGSVGGGAGGGANQTFNITTQEIDPRRHAAELGWLLNGKS